MKIREIIKENGISYKKIAEILQISRFGLYKKLNGNTRFKEDELEKIASFLNIPVEDLTDD